MSSFSADSHAPHLFKEVISAYCTLSSGCDRLPSNGASALRQQVFGLPSEGIVSEMGQPLKKRQQLLGQQGLWELHGP